LDVPVFYYLTVENLCGFLALQYTSYRALYIRVAYVDCHLDHFCYVCWKWGTWNAN